MNCGYGECRVTPQLSPDEAKRGGDFSGVSFRVFDPAHVISPSMRDVLIPCVVSETLTASCPLKELTPIMPWEAEFPSDGIWLWFLGTL